MKIHTLKSGATVISTSPGHGFRFSDGTVAAPQDKDVCDKLTLQRESHRVTEIKEMAVNRTAFVLPEEAQDFLRQLCTLADIVIVPFPVLNSLHEQGIRHRYPNAVAFNATTETQRSPPQDKVVDINNWSW